MRDLLKAGHVCKLAKIIEVGLKTQKEGVKMLKGSKLGYREAHKERSGGLGARNAREDFAKKKIEKDKLIKGLTRNRRTH